MICSSRLVHFAEAALEAGPLSVRPGHVPGHVPAWLTTDDAGAPAVVYDPAISPADLAIALEAATAHLLDQARARRRAALASVAELVRDEPAAATGTADEVSEVDAHRARRSFGVVDGGAG